MHILMAPDCSPVFSCVLTLDLTNLAAIVLRTALVYVAVVLGLRVFGKRERAQMNLFDFVLLLVLSNAVQNAMTGGDNTLDGGLLSALTLLVMDRIFNILTVRFAMFHRLLAGDPSVLIEDGKLVQANMRREGVSESDLLEILRQHDLDSVRQVHWAILETDGQISIMPAATKLIKARRPGSHAPKPPEVPHEH